MPRSGRARVKVYLPDLPSPAYQELLERLEQEFTDAFGGSTLIRGLSGNYLSRLGLPVQDRVNLLFTDGPFTFEEGFSRRSWIARTSTAPAS